MSDKLLFALTAVLLAAVLVIAVLAERGGSAPAGRAPASDRPVASADPSRLVRPGSPTLGPADAKVTIVEFLDPACETCAVFYPEVKRMLSANPGRIRLVTRHVPFHQGSEAVVAMLGAAQLQGKYWETLDALLGAQDRWVHNHRVQADAAMAVVAGVPGIDVDRLKGDMGRPEVRERGAQDLADAQALKVLKTPEYFVNGTPLPSFGLDQLQALVDAALRR
jgi:protein-disulfide isomerase